MNDETPLQQEILKALSKIPGVLAWRQNVGYARGLRTKSVFKLGPPDGASDIVCIAWGRPFLIEVKTGDNGQSPQQRNFQAQAEKAGATYFVARSVEDALEGIGAAAPSAGEGK